MDERLVVVTGMGAVSPVGNSVEESWQSLLAGKSGIEPMDRINLEGCRCRIGGIVHDFDATKVMSAKEQKRMDLFCQYAMYAGHEAMESAGLGEYAEDPTRFGVLVSSGIGGMTSLSEQMNVLYERGIGRVSPTLVPMMINNMASGLLAIKYNLQGPNFAVVSACASGLHSIGEASWVIKRGDADLMLAGGAECPLIPIGYGAFASMRALSERNDDPKGASRPFDKERDGFVPAEGASMLVLEEYEHARKRGAHILGFIAGYGATCDAFHVTAPREDAECTSRCIRQAFKSAQLPIEELGYINAHGTSTPMNDRLETLAIKRALGDYAYRVPVSSSKSMTGHMMGAAGSFESIVCLCALNKGAVPPTINQFTPDADCDLDYVPNVAREADVKLALNLSFGFGGHNAAVLFKRA